MRRVVLALFLFGCSSSETSETSEDAAGAVDSAVVDSTAPAEDTAATADSSAPETAETLAPDTIAPDTAPVVDAKPDAPCTPCGASACCTATEACVFDTCVSCGSMLACDGSCVDHQNNPAHCGACNKVCGTGKVCVAGACVDDCPPDRTECGGWCRDSMIDPNHCGGCAFACPIRPNASPACTGGKCGFKCYAGYDDCNASAADGCEVRTDGAHKNCGMCGRACAANEVCSAGACVPGKYVFATKAVFTGSLGGHAGADTICQNAATAAGLPGTYLAWMNAPATRFVRSSGRYVLTSGVSIADNWTDLVDGTLSTAIRLDEYGMPLTLHTQVWTDANAQGTAFALSKNCAGWNSSSSSTRGSYGTSTKTDKFWAGYLGEEWECSIARHLYCFQQ